MKKKNVPGWLRWLYLFMAFAGPFAVWMDFRDYQRYNSYGLFSEERWAEMIAGFQFRWAAQGLMALCFFYLFLTLTWDKDNSQDHSFLDQLFATALVLVWGCLPLAIPLIDNAQALWCIMMVVFIVVAGRGWVKYFEIKKQEEP